MKSYRPFHGAAIWQIHRGARTDGGRGLACEDGCLSWAEESLVAVRHVLSRHVPAVRPSGWQFISNSYGKPQVANELPEPIYFNLSHSGDYLIVAISHDAPLGVDIEGIDPEFSIEDIIECCFAPTEQADLASKSACERHRYFAGLWSLKEAYGKALGIGLGVGLDAVAFHIDKMGLVTSSLDNGDENWTFHLYELKERYQVALAIQSGMRFGDDHVLVVRDISIADLVAGIGSE